MPTLRDKFHGCIAASWCGSAMGAAVEGWPPEKIEQEYGHLDRFLSYGHYTDVTDWKRPPGTTEDGIERQKLIATAIIEKQDRVLAEDVASIWARDLTSERIVYKQEAFDRHLMELIKSGMPAVEVGRLWLYPNVVSLARSSHPIGLINAGDPQSAADDCFEVGKLYCQETAFAVRWAALYNAAIAEACKPDATVDSVLAAAREFASYRAQTGTLYAHYDTVQQEVNRALDVAAKHTDPGAMRDEFAEHYFGGFYFNYGLSQANEIVAKGLAVFAITKGDPKQAVLTAVNFGRDTDCLAAVAGGLAGALSGTASLPPDWIRLVNDATKQDPYTNNQRTIEETADGIFEAFLARRRRLQALLDSMGEDEALGA